MTAQSVQSFLSRLGPPARRRLRQALLAGVLLGAASPSAAACFAGGTVEVGQPSGPVVVMGPCFLYSVTATWCSVPATGIFRTGVVATTLGPLPCLIGAGTPHGPYSHACGAACSGELRQQIRDLTQGPGLIGTQNFWFVADAQNGVDRWSAASTAPVSVRRSDRIVVDSLVRQGDQGPAYQGETLSFSMSGSSPDNAANHCGLSAAAIWKTTLLDAAGAPIPSSTSTFGTPVTSADQGGKVFVHTSTMSMPVPSGLLCGQKIRVTGRIFMSDGLEASEEASPFGDAVDVPISVRPSVSLVGPLPPPPAVPGVFIDHCVFPSASLQVSSCGCRTAGNAPEHLPVSFAAEGGSGQFEFRDFAATVAPCQGVAFHTVTEAGGNPPDASRLYRLNVTDMNGQSPPSGQRQVVQVSAGSSLTVLVQGTAGAVATVRAESPGIEPSSQSLELAGATPQSFVFRAGGGGTKILGLRATLACYEPYPGPGYPGLNLLNPNEVRIDADTCQNTAVTVGLIPVELDFTGTVRFGSKINDNPAGTGDCSIPVSELGFQAPLCDAVVTLSRDGTVIGSFTTQADGTFSIKHRPPDIESHQYSLAVHRDGFDKGDKTQVLLDSASCSQPGAQALELYLNPASCPVPGSNPIHPISGEHRLSVSDLRAPGRAGLDFSFERHYRVDTAMEDLGLGHGWTHNWMVALKDDGRGNKLVRFTDGEYHTLVPDGALRYKGVPGFFYTLDFSFNRWNLRDTQGARYEFDAYQRLQGVTDRHGNHIEISRDDIGRISSIEDSAGRTYAFGYDPDHGRLTTLTAPDPGMPHGRVWTYGYSPTGDLVSVRGPGSGSGYQADYGYDARHWMTSKDEPKDAKGLKHLDIGYDHAGRVLTEKRKGSGDLVVGMEYGVAGTRRNQYTVNGYSTLVLIDNFARSAGREVNGSATFEAWDPGNQGATERRDFRGNSTKTTYYPNNRGEVHTVEDPDGLVTEYVYDPHGLGVPVEIHRYHKDRPSQKRSTVSTVNSFGQVLTQTEGGNRVSRYRYEPQGFGQWTSLTDPDGTVFVREFWPDGQVRRFINQTDNLVTEYTYDGWGRLKTVLNTATQLLVTHTYDGSGNVVATTQADPHGSSGTSADYDDDGRLERRVDERGQETTFGYSTDGRDNVETETGPSGTYVRRSIFDPFKDELQASVLEGPDGLSGTLNRRTEYGYEQAGCCSAQGRLNRTTVKGAQVGTQIRDLATTFEYDPDGNRTAIRSPKAGHDQTSTYDGLGRMETQTLGSGAEARTLTFGYNDFGDRDELIDGKTQRTEFGYDQHGQMTSETPPSGPALSYGYTSAGKLNKKTNRLNQVWNARYDGTGRMTHEDFPGPQGLIQHDFIYGSVGSGTDQLTRVQDPTGVTEFKYGHRGRLERSLHPDLNRQLKRGYDPAGNLTGLELLDYAGSPLKASSYTYDPLNRMETYTDWGGNRFEYRYNAANQVTRVRLYPQGQSQPAYTATHIYDNAGQLLSIRYRKGSSGLQIAKVEYQYDEAGNRTSKASLGTEAQYGYNTNNELVQDQNSGDIRGSQTFNYDKAGNRQSVTWSTGSQSYSTPNSLNQLKGTGIGPNGAFQFDYDAEGSRIGKFVNETQGQGEMEGSTNYVWDGKTRLHQVSLPDGAVIAYAYDYQNRMVSRTKGSETRTFLHGTGNQVIEEVVNGQRLGLYGWGADGLVSRTDSNGQTLFYLKDGLFSVIAVIDERGTIVQSLEYSAYGESLSGKDAVNPFRFVGGFGGYTDDDTGLIQFWNRWYDPKVGRWVSEDPIRHDGGANLYGYVKNHVTGQIDFNGLCSAVFSREAGTLSVYSGAGVLVKSCPAANNSPFRGRNTNPYLDGGNGPAPNGTFSFGIPVYNRGANGNSDTGSFGPIFIPIIIPIQYPLLTPRAQVGLHSGQRTQEDKAGRKGPKHGTMGCVRTTDECTKALAEMYESGDVYPWTITIR